MEFTEQEKKIIKDKQIFTTKISIIYKIEKLFEEVRKLLKISIEKSGYKLSSDIDLISGKILRGENYLSLPYVVLDYPKLFSENDVFTFDQ